MKRTTKIVVTVLAVVGIASGTAAVARGGHGGMGAKMVSHMTERLNLDEQQASALGVLQEELIETRELMRGNADNDQQRLKDMISAESFDQGAALELITQRTTAMQAQAPELVAAAAGFLDGLSAEQKQELSELMERFGGRHGKRANKAQ